MQKNNVVRDEQYHEDAIKYNQAYVDKAAALDAELTNPEIRRWNRAVSKQHKKHADLHQRSLDRLRNIESNTKEEQNVSTADDPTPEVTPTDPAPTSEPVESTPDPEQAAEPTENGVGTPEDIAGGGGSADPEDSAVEIGAEEKYEIRA